MEEICAACLVYEPGVLEYADFRKTGDPVWILGKKYNALNDEELENLRQDIRSKLWFTYRKQFSPIGNTGFSTDTGWGCMHRCGQMVMAQTLLMKYLGREWMWDPESLNHLYITVRDKFNDNEECTYSVHRLATQGDILDKRIGEWFGPNTIAQVLKKLTLDNAEDNVAIHVALDNMVIRKEIKKTCKEFVSRRMSKSQGKEFSQINKNMQKQDSSANTGEDEPIDSFFSPLLLIIPLRLGLSDIIPNYFEKLKAVFTFKQCVGIIGGRTNHASYFIGYVGDDLIYLDPHTTQPYTTEMMDETYHCAHAGQMSFKQLDPSIALCFYCEDEKDFEDWCTKARNVLLYPESDALFEILEDKLPMIPYSDDSDDICGFSAAEADQKYTSDDEFELL